MNPSRRDVGNFMENAFPNSENNILIVNDEKEKRKRGNRGNGQRVEEVKKFVKKHQILF